MATVNVLKVELIPSNTFKYEHLNESNVFKDGYQLFCDGYVFSRLEGTGL